MTKIKTDRETTEIINLLPLNTEQHMTQYYTAKQKSNYGFHHIFM